MKIADIFASSLPLHRRESRDNGGIHFCPFFFFLIHELLVIFELNFVTST